MAPDQRGHTRIPQVKCLMPKKFWKKGEEASISEKMVASFEAAVREAEKLRSMALVQKDKALWRAHFKARAFLFEKRKEMIDYCEAGWTLAAMAHKKGKK